MTTNDDPPAPEALDRAEKRVWPVPGPLPLRTDAEWRAIKRPFERVLARDVATLQRLELEEIVDQELARRRDAVAAADDTRKPSAQSAQPRPLSPANADLLERAKALLASDRSAWHHDEKVAYGAEIGTPNASYLAGKLLGAGTGVGTDAELERLRKALGHKRFKDALAPPYLDKLWLALFGYERPR